MADTSSRGFASMDEDKQREIARKGGEASSGKFGEGKNDPSEAGKKGAQNQPREAKAEGGRNSHKNDDNR